MGKSALNESAIRKLSFEEALERLESIVGRLENGKETLEQAIEDYTTGTALRAHCEKKLAEARLKVDKIIAGEDGDMALEPEM